MPATFSTVDPILKEDYLPGVKEQLNNASMLISQLDVNNDSFDTEGRRWLSALRTGRNSGVGARATGGTLPTAGNQGYRDIYGPVRNMYARIQLDRKVIKAMKSNRGSFLRATESEMDGATTDSARDYDRQAWWTGDGLLATCGTSGPSTTVALAAATTQAQMLALADGFLVDLGTTGSPTSLATAATVVSVNTTAKTLVLSVSVTVTGSNIFSRSGAYGVSTNTGLDNDGQIELTGMKLIMNPASTLHTLAPATEPKWQPYVNALTAGTAFNETLVDKAMMTTETQSGQAADLLVGSGGVHRAIVAQGRAYKRFNDTVDMKGGHKAVQYSSSHAGGQGTVTQYLTWNWWMDDGTLWGINTGDLQFNVLEDWDWMDDDGAVLSRVSGKDQLEAYLVKYADLSANRRNSHWATTGLAEL